MRWPCSLVPASRPSVSGRSHRAATLVGEVSPERRRSATRRPRHSRPTTDSFNRSRSRRPIAAPASVAGWRTRRGRQPPAGRRAAQERDDAVPRRQRAVDVERGDDEGARRRSMPSGTLVGPAAPSMLPRTRASSSHDVGILDLDAAAPPGRAARTPSPGGDRGTCAPCAVCGAAGSTGGRRGRRVRVDAGSGGARARQSPRRSLSLARMKPDTA